MFVGVAKAFMDIFIFFMFGNVCVFFKKPGTPRIKISSHSLEWYYVNE